MGEPMKSVRVPMLSQSPPGGQRNERVSHVHQVQVGVTQITRLATSSGIFQTSLVCQQHFGPTNPNLERALSLFLAFSTVQPKGIPTCPRRHKATRPSLRPQRSANQMQVILTGQPKNRRKLTATFHHSIPFLRIQKRVKVDLCRLMTNRGG